MLPSNALGSKPVEWVKDEAAQLRQRLDEMVHQLAIRFPVYLVISKCDLLAGFNEFFESLPESEKAQAMGFVNSDSVNAGASGFPQRAFRTICERAARLQVASLAEVDRDDVARRLFIFPAELKTLQEPLRFFSMSCFVQVLIKIHPSFVGFSLLPRAKTRRRRRDWRAFSGCNI